MGFDLTGVKPKNEIGVYFQNSVWGWRPLWQYIDHLTTLIKENGIPVPNLLTEDDILRGNYNDGHLIPKEKADSLSQLLRDSIKNGVANAYAIEYKRIVDNKPLEECKLCKGSGVRNDPDFNGTCDGCKGSGKVKNWLSHYPFSVQNVQEFAEFSGASGGFKIY